jgi:hypothetical protein
MNIKLTAPAVISEKYGKNPMWNIIIPKPV